MGGGARETDRLIVGNKQVSKTDSNGVLLRCLTVQIRHISFAPDGSFAEKRHNFRTPPSSCPKSLTTICCSYEPCPSHIPLSDSKHTLLTS
jgi:hypothetical protein